MLCVQQYDVRIGWLPRELIAESMTENISGVQLAADARGNVVLVWNQGTDIFARRFG